MEISEELSEEHIDGILFQKQDVDKFKKDLDNKNWKYKKLSEYHFDETAYYKIYIDSFDRFNVKRLSEYEILTIEEHIKLSKIIKDSKILFKFEIYFENDFTEEDSLKIIDCLHCDVELTCDSESKEVIQFQNYILTIYEDENTREIFVNKVIDKSDFNYATEKKNEIINQWIERNMPFEIEQNKNVAWIGDDYEIVPDWLIRKIKVFLGEKYGDLYPGAIKFKFIKDADELASLATANEEELSHSWAGSQGNVVKFEIIEGDIIFGLDSHYQYSDNGNMNTPIEQRIDVDFKKNSMICFFKHNRSWNHYNNNDNDYDEYEIVLYIGIQ
jgi:hypothetical protein